MAAVRRQEAVEGVLAMMGQEMGKVGVISVWNRSGGKTKVEAMWSSRSDFRVLTKTAQVIN